MNLPMLLLAFLCHLLPILFQYGGVASAAVTAILSQDVCLAGWYDCVYCFAV
ncbi:hypothetical protein SESBI_03392 [Sesbania bispinosa]|nr:hypothetical protein SESBI_03392 [Sesbania bispinosa]